MGSPPDLHVIACSPKQSIVSPHLHLQSLFFFFFLQVLVNLPGIQRIFSGNKKKMPPARQTSGLLIDLCFYILQLILAKFGLHWAYYGSQTVLFVRAEIFQELVTCMFVWCSNSLGTLIYLHYAGCIFFPFSLILTFFFLQT